MTAHWLTAHSQYFFWVAYLVAGGLLTWKHVPLTLVRLVGAFTKDAQRHRQCAEILRLARKDAASIPSYVSELPPPSDSAAKPPTDGTRAHHRRQARGKYSNDAATPRAFAPADATVGRNGPWPKARHG